MFVFGFLSIILIATVAIAQGAQPMPQQPTLANTLLRMLPMFLMVYGIFYFLVARPQQKKIVEHQELLKSLKKGDTVVTSGGIVGKVAVIEEGHVTLDSVNCKLRVESGHVVKKAA